jgi:predicted P-loop ATPase
MQLTAADYAALERSYITRAIADAAGLYRVPSIEGRELVGRNGGGDYSGIAFPGWWPGVPGNTHVHLRLDNPPLDHNGKPIGKYLTAPGTRNRIYCPLADPASLADVSLDALITEGPKKYLSAYRAAAENCVGGKPLFLTLAIFGVWSWKGTIGIKTDSNGRRVEEKGVIPDFDKIAWDGRRVYLLFDANVATNPMVAAARAQLARELESRGALVYLVDLPGGPGINGVDDFLGQQGTATALTALLQNAHRYDWREALAKSAKGLILPTFGNALIALRHAPEWRGVLGFNEFALQSEIRCPPPWGGKPEPWRDYHDSMTMEWLEHQGIPVGPNLAGRGALTVAEEHRYHPVRDYLDDLKWDRVERIDDWLTLYLGVDPTDYTRAVGARWLISGVARIRQPGCRADCALILEGLQGTFKSTTFQILGGAFYSDDIAELGTKDASLGTAGVWIVELAELDAMGRAEVSKVKAFLSRSTDRFRPPYGRHMIWAPRQCVFGGTVNGNKYLKDETGGRRFWPVACGDVKLNELRRDRDQLWAEADARYGNGDHWWLDTKDLVNAATDEQEQRYSFDPWEPLIEKWLENKVALQHAAESFTTANALEFAIFKDKGQWTRTDEVRVGFVFSRLGWESYRPGGKGTRPRAYRKKGTP